MSRLLDQLCGPYFDFLVLDEYVITKWDDEGVPCDVIPSYYHHPDALKISDSIVGIGTFCFAESHPEFNYFGSTIYQGETLDKLLMWLDFFVQGLLACSQSKEFERYTRSLFNFSCTESIGPLQSYWPLIRDEVVMFFEEIIFLGIEAKEHKKVLLVLGV